MILGQVSWLDCFVFLIFLAPQLIIHIGFFTTLITGLKALPFLLIKLPLGFIHDHFVLSQPNRSPFVQQASWFEDVVIRCVRYAFADIPANIGRVFFSKPVSLPFLRFRMLRHGYIHSPIQWQEINRRDFKALWITKDASKPPDVTIYYIHGGGFSMGSSYFYLEFLLAYTHLLSLAGYTNPCILALEYTLVPDASYPTQIQQALAAYSYLLTLTPASRIVVSGDSAGGTIILSMLLHLATAALAAAENALPAPTVKATALPAFAALISPWVTLVSDSDVNTPSDYLDAASLHLYARQYAGALSTSELLSKSNSTSNSKSKSLPKRTDNETSLLNARHHHNDHHHSPSDPLISPGNCHDVTLWRSGTPTCGFFVAYGREEVFAPEIRRWIARMEEAGVHVERREAKGGIHAWPVASLFLSGSLAERQRGLKEIVEVVREKVGL